MTALERTKNLVEEFLPAAQHGPGIRKRAAEEIFRAIIEHSNEETERRRAAENLLKGIQAGGPVVVCDENRTRLRVWNDVQKRWAETSMVMVGEAKQDV